jgi:hypothetical protein
MVGLFSCGRVPALPRYPPPKSSSSGGGLTFSCRWKSCGRRESPISQPLSLRDIPFQGNTDLSLWSGRAAPMLQLSAKVSLTRMPRRWSAFSSLEYQVTWFWGI